VQSVSAVATTALVPVALIVVGWGLGHYSTRAVLGVVLALQTASILSVVGGALAERSSLRAAAVDSPA
jgi:hypothetical protein